jgi:cytochrome b
MEKTRINVWDLPTRAFHWLLVLSFAGAFITAESERVRDVHVALGYAFAGLIAFRLAWGVVGGRHARFASFVRGPRTVGRYLRSLFTRSPEHHAGHNPAGGWAILAILALGMVTVVSGYMAYNELGGRGLGELHEVAANALLGLVFLHVAAVVVSSFVHRENLVAAMITGRKNGAPEDGIAGTRWAPAVALAAAVVGLGGLALGPSDPPATGAKATGADASGTHHSRHHERGDDERGDDT